MLHRLAWQDAGRERALQVGECPDVPDPIARTWISRGWARAVQPAPAERREVAMAAVPSVKRRRR